MRSGDQFGCRFCVLAIANGGESGPRRCCRTRAVQLRVSVAGLAAAGERDPPVAAFQHRQGGAGQGAEHEGADHGGGCRELRANGSLGRESEQDPRGPPGGGPRERGASAAGRLEEDVVGAVGDLALTRQGVEVAGVLVGRGRATADRVDALDVRRGLEAAPPSWRWGPSGAASRWRSSRRWVPASRCGGDDAAVAGLPPRPRVVAADSLAVLARERRRGASSRHA